MRRERLGPDDHLRPIQRGERVGHPAQVDHLDPGLALRLASRRQPVVDPLQLQRAPPLVIVEPGDVQQVEGAGRLGVLAAPPPGHHVAHPRLVFDDHPPVPVVHPEPGVRHPLHPARHQVDRRVALPKGGQPVQFLGQFHRKLTQRHLPVDPVPDPHVGVARLADRVREPPPELRDQVGVERQPRRAGVPAVFDQEVRLGGDARADVHPRHRARRSARRLAVVQGEHHRRLAVLLHQPRGDDPDHARVPVRPGQHQPLELQQRGVGAHRVQRRCVNLVLDLLALVVQPFELVGDLLGGRHVVRGQKLDRQARVRQPPQRVQARPHLEADCVRREVRRVDLRGGHQRLQAYPLRVAQRLDPQLQQVARVEPLSRHVRDDAQRHQVEELFLFPFAPGQRVQLLHQHVGDAHPWQVAQGVAFGQALRVDDRCVGQRGGQGVVVGDQHRQPVDLRRVDRFVGVHARIAGQDHPDAVLAQQVHQHVDLHPVPVFEPVRHVIGHPRPQVAQGVV